MPLRRAGRDDRRRVDGRVDERRRAPAHARDRRRALLVALAAAAVEEGRDQRPHARARRAARGLRSPTRCSRACGRPGPTCHTGAPTCFGASRIDDHPPTPARRSRSRSARDSATGEKSYTKSLLDAGMAEDPREDRRGARRARGRAADRQRRRDVIHEAADLLFHVMVGLTARKIPIERVLARARAPVRHERPRREGGARNRDPTCSRPAAARSARSRTTRIAPSSARCRRRSPARSPRRGRCSSRPAPAPARRSRISCPRSRRASASSCRPARVRCRIRSRATTSRCCARSSRGRSPRSCSRASSNYVCRRALAEARSAGVPASSTALARLGRAHRDRRSRRGRVAARGRAGVGRCHDRRPMRASGRAARTSSAAS